MYIKVDVSSIPPVTTLHEPDDFGSLKVVVQTEGDAFIAPEVIREMAGERAQDAGWRDGLEKMVHYARDHGWIDDAGRIQAHIES